VLFILLLGTVAASQLSADEKFANYKTDFAKTYATTEAEASAKAAFIDNDAIILEHNAKKLSYWLGHNPFSDLTLAEFTATYVGKFSENPTLNRERNFDYSLLKVKVAANSSLDWSTKGAVTPVKNQAQCGSCWAFSTTGSIEGAYQIAGNPLTSLSEQELVSCDNSAHGGTDNGCNGGLMDNAFKWIEKNGICLEADYPYTSGSGSSGTCKTSCKKVVTVTGLTDVPGEAGMLAALAIGPVSVAIEADKSAFQLYKGGVLDNAACGKQLDHGVLAMGYGTDSGKDYYKVKNSWGAAWGEAGYIRMVQGKDQCGIADAASYPTGASKIVQPTPPPTPPPAPTPPTPPTPAAPTPPPTPSGPNCVETSGQKFPCNGAIITTEDACKAAAPLCCWDQSTITDPWCYTPLPSNSTN
jgi:C1A family cysteine protease